MSLCVMSSMRCLDTPVNKYKFFIPFYLTACSGSAVRTAWATQITALASPYPTGDRHLSNLLSLPGDWITSHPLWRADLMKDHPHHMLQARWHPDISTLPTPWGLTQIRGSLSKRPRALKMSWRLHTLITPYNDFRLPWTTSNIRAAVLLPLYFDHKLCVPGFCFYQNWYLCSCIIRCFKETEGCVWFGFFLLYLLSE